MTRCVAILTAIFLFAACDCAGEPSRLDRIVVTPLRNSDSAMFAGSLVSTVDQALAGKSVYTALSDILGSVGMIDMRRRGIEGTQADVNMRGAGFDQNAVLVNGIPVNDPQTGHFTMDLPLTSFDIDQVEVVKGASAGIYGANAFGGALNIQTKPAGTTAAIVEAEGGSFDYARAGASVGVPVGIAQNRFSIESSRSTGYMPETGFGILGLTDAVSVESPYGMVDALFGYSRKDLAAADFYSSRFPNEEEHIDTRLFTLGGTLESAAVTARPKLFLRRHRDKFMLDQNRPGWQTNYSTNYTKGAQYDLVYEHSIADVAYGVRFIEDTIDSTNLDRHRRTTAGFSVELKPHTGRFFEIAAGVREDYASRFGWECGPALSARLTLREDLTFRAQTGRTYRVPTFTDLYYNDAANIGNADLRCEYAWSYEGGVEYKRGGFSFSATYFHRDTYNTIDWIRFRTSDPWQATNIGSVRTNGIESGIEYKIADSPVECVFLGYNALDVFHKHDYESKYALDYLKGHVTSGVTYSVAGFKNSWIINFKKRIGDSGYIVIDSIVSRELVRRDHARLEVFCKVENISDVPYSEQSGIQMPGRWIRAGGRLTF